MILSMLDDYMLAAGALAAATLAIWKVLIPAGRRLHAWAERGGRALDILNGSPEVIDPDRPGEILRPAIPDMGVRMTAVEGLLNEFVLRDLHANVQQAREAAEGAARDARKALRGVADLRAASEIWHAGELDVLTAIERNVAKPTTTEETL
ncbi:hypothetical protein RN607_00745 [Demequina capsici]|uniref:Uncharacterized protein n=1 Tax=Demequina capsici TaxID=3075620 RepID=A0AA96FB70_9MICO|nr:hypothetical protein [Demequina sp. PMTSA13]WNM27561.1 hypothetical protein RN607_00745 [Demequina sp. PMTSA13]